MLPSGLVCKAAFLVGCVLCLDDHDNEDDGDVKEEGDGGQVVSDVVMVVMTVMTVVVVMTDKLRRRTVVVMGMPQ